MSFLRKNHFNLHKTMIGGDKHAPCEEVVA